MLHELEGEEDVSLSQNLQILPTGQDSQSNIHISLEKFQFWKGQSNAGV